MSFHFSELDEYLCRARFKRCEVVCHSPFYLHLLSIPSSSAAVHKSRSSLGNGAVSHMHFSSVSLVATAASICVHVQEELNRQLAFLL